MRSSPGPLRRSSAPPLRLGLGLLRGSRRRLWLAVAVPLVVALLAALVGLGLGYGAHSLRVGGSAVGTVEDRTRTRDSVDVDLSFRVNGVDVVCSTSDVDGDPQVGDLVQVRYALDDPEGTCAVGRAGQSYAPAGIAGAISAAAAGRLGWVLLARRRTRRPGPDDGEVWTDSW